MLISFNMIKYMIALIRYFSAIWCLLSTSDVNLHLPAMLRAFTRLATSRSSHHYLTNETFHLRLYVQIVTAHRKMYVLDLPDLRRRRSINLKCIIVAVQLLTIISFYFGAQATVIRRHPKEHSRTFKASCRYSLSVNLR